jgi:Leucine Rich Repeat (LRR) protein
MAVPASTSTDSTTGELPRARRWIPLSLRMFVALLLLLGVGSAVSIGLPAYRQQVAVREIERLGGTFITRPRGPEWLRARLGADLLKLLDPVIQVAIYDQRASDDTLRQIAGLAGLEYLSFSEGQTTDSGLAFLAESTKLHYLSLHGNTKVTDVGLTHLQGLSKLEYLGLVRTQVTDAGLEHLKGFKNLRELNLNNTQVTDKGLIHLKTLNRLRTLWLDKTEVTDEGVADLQRALPEAMIWWCIGGCKPTAPRAADR